MNRLLRELEEAVVDAWPAEHTDEQDGWFLRASGGPTHRGNSVSTLEARGDATLDERIGRVEGWYRTRNLPTMFQVGPCAEPAGLDDALAQRGYRKESESMLALAPPEEVLARSTRGAFETSVAARASDGWIEIAVRASRFAEAPQVLLGTLKRLGTRCRYALSRNPEGRPVAAALGISSEDRLGVYAMVTAPAQRRHGAAEALLHALAQSALADGMRELYLLVELANEPACALYRATGFQELYRYHYRVQPLLS